MGLVSDWIFGDISLDRWPISSIFPPLEHILIQGVKYMAKPASILVRLVSAAETGYFYVVKKNPRNITEKFQFRKYDPVVRKHVMFKEAKIK